MTVQPKPSPDCHPAARMGADRPQPRGRIPALPSTVQFESWPVAFEVEPWRP